MVLDCLSQPQRRESTDALHSKAAGVNFVVNLNKIISNGIAMVSVLFTEYINAKLPKNINPNNRILEFSITFVEVNSLIYGWLQT